MDEVRAEQREIADNRASEENQAVLSRKST